MIGAFRMPVEVARVSACAARTCVSSIVENSATSVSIAGFLKLIPALLTRIETFPVFATILSTSAGRVSKAVTSAASQ